MAVVISERVRKTEGQWNLPLVDAEVTQLIIDHSFTLRLVRGELGATIRIESTFEIRDGDESYFYDPENREGLGRALRVFGCQVLDSVVEAGGILRLTFVTGPILTVKPNADYEAWEYSSSVGERIVCAPAGELVMWL